MPSRKVRTATPDVAPVEETTIDTSPLIVTERDGTTHVLTPELSVEGGTKMAWIAETSGRIEARLTELQALDVDATTDHVITTVLSLQSRLTRMNEEMMRAIVPDYPAGLFGRLGPAEALRMVARAMELAVHSDG